jgi:hypothetical protein
VVQIAGLVARRIVCDVKPGDVLATGERFGMIRFGSRLDIYLPDGVRRWSRGPDDGRGRDGDRRSLIILAAVLDGMDGLVARRLNAQSHFGAELDSLSDFVCFGVAPGVFVFHFAMQDMAGIWAGWRCCSTSSAPACGSRAST